MNYRYRSLRNSSNLLVLNLAIADLIMSLGNLPMFSIASFHEKWIFGNLGCQMYGFLGAFGSLLSMNTLTMIALERSIVIMDKIPWSSRSSTKTVAGFIFFTWVYSAFWASAPVCGWGRYVLEGSQASCTFDFISQDMKYKSFVITLLICCFYIQITIIFWSYLLIFLKVVRNEREIRSLSNREAANPLTLRMVRSRRKEKREFHIAKIALGIILAFCLAWLPYATVTMIACFGDSSKINILGASIPGLCAKCATAINPILYALLHPKYKSKLIPCRPLFVSKNTNISNVTLKLHSNSPRKSPIHKQYSSASMKQKSSSSLSEMGHCVL